MRRECVGLIVARSGSKGIKGKNLRELEGKRLIVWTIEAALQSGVLTNVFVSTDSEDIAEVAKKHGAEVPFIRPPHLATDVADSAAVAKHFLDWMNSSSLNPSHFMLLQPTSPLRSAEDIAASWQQLEEKNATGIVSVCEMDHNPLFSNTLPSDNSMKDFLKPEFMGKRRQELPKYYRVNGAIYIQDTQYFRNNMAWINDNTYAYIMPRSRSVDIDEEVDLLIASSIIKSQRSKLTSLT